MKEAASLDGDLGRIPVVNRVLAPLLRRVERLPTRGGENVLVSLVPAKGK